ncbi:hypothetical protein BC829DRAFT_405241 [Chytridium lagenaria]|nr:hypothetical protein BC829DRAFT_405241 [Chytridium lagenaria]
MIFYVKCCESKKNFNSIHVILILFICTLFLFCCSSYFHKHPSFIQLLFVKCSAVISPHIPLILVVLFLEKIP